jgi:DNA modification methylase
LIYLGDCVAGMEKMASCIDLAITSAPYNVRKEYEKNWTFSDFSTLMENVFKQVHRLLKPGGYFVVNFGDCYNSGDRFYQADVPSVFPASMWYYKWGVEQNGFDLQATRIWRKKFAKLSIPFVCNDHPRNVFDYEHIWSFRKKNGSNVEFVNDRKLSQRGVLGEDWDSSANLADHCAAFPVELPLWAIDVYSHPRDVVLDPFSGSGTTALAADARGREFIGFEKDPEFHAYSVARLAKHNDSMVVF